MLQKTIIIVILGASLSLNVLFLIWIAKKRRGYLKTKRERDSLEIRAQARTRQLAEQYETLKKENEERTRQLKARLADLEKFHQLAVGRESRISELKELVKKLESRLKNNSNGK